MTSKTIKNMLTLNLESPYFIENKNIFNLIFKYHIQHI